MTGLEEQNSIRIRLSRDVFTFVDKEAVNAYTEASRKYRGNPGGLDQDESGRD